MTDFLVALGLVFVIEGLIFAASPGAAKNAMAHVLETPDNVLRIVGIASAAIGALRARPAFRPGAAGAGRAARAAGRHGLRGGDVDHRVDHGFGDIGDVVGTARGCRRCEQR